MQLHVRMSSRDPDEPHRGATPLELFLDLTFVVAIAQAAASLHHALLDGHAGEAIGSFPLVFFGVWWAWMNFTWFASAYDTDDALYRLAVFVQMAGVLVMAAGIPRAMVGQDLGVMVVGYVVMRLAMVGQWLRAAASHPEGRASALRYAGGIFVVQVLWVARSAVPERLFVPSFLALAAAEMVVPLWAESVGRTAWHPRHIAERYGLFTIIVLGESLLAATVGVQVALDAESTVDDLAPVIVGGLLIVFAMWWTYFDLPTEQMVTRARNVFDQTLTGAFTWGYGHYVVFASAAAAGTGLAVAVDQAVGPTGLSDLEAGFTITVPATIYLVAVWALHFRYKAPSLLRDYAVPVGAALILATSWTPEPVLMTGLVLAALTALAVATNSRRAAREASITRA